MKKSFFYRINKRNIKKITSNKLFLILVFLVSLSVPLIVLNKSEYVVVLSDSGFNPTEITVQKGTTVTWKIEGDSHWPASDNHPTHTVYPEGGGCLGSRLDACREMKRGESYSFKFEQEGKWGIHDHINPRLTMTVNVEGGKQSFNDYKSENRHRALFSPAQRKALKEFSSGMTVEKAAEEAKNICSDLEGSKLRDTQQCYAEVFYFITKDTDQKFAFRTVSALRNIDNSARICHLMAHGIGSAVYDKDPNNWKEAIGKVSPECSYGQIHGILEAYSSSGANPFEEKKLPEVCSKNPNWACYHGMGHVILVQSGNNLEKSAALCNALPKKSDQGYCLNGVFMEHMIGQGLENHGIITSERRKLFYEHLDEFEKLCSSQTREDYIKACWTEIIHASNAKFRGNVDDIYALCAKAQTPAGRKGCRLHALAEILPQKDFDPFAAQKICSIKIEDDPNFENGCYTMVAGVVMSNMPNKANEVVTFCSSLEKQHQDSCFAQVKKETALLRRQDPEQANNNCKLVADEYKSVCSGED